MKADEARLLALGFPGATEEDHHGRPSYRVRGRIFATAPDADHLHVMVDVHDAHAAVAEEPGSYELLWWGRSLSGVRARLDVVEAASLAGRLEEAWRRRAPKRAVAAFDAGEPDGPG